MSAHVARTRHQSPEFREGQLGRVGGRSLQRGDGGGAGPVATINGDVNGSGAIDIADAQYLLNWLFLGGPDPVAIAQEGGGLTAVSNRWQWQHAPHAGGVVRRRRE